MYDTKKRVALVKKRMIKYRHRQERIGVCRLSALCVLLFLFLTGIVGIMHDQPADVTGMYGTILLYGDAGGYVLVAVASFILAVVITTLCIRYGIREQNGQNTENEKSSHLLKENKNK